METKEQYNRKEVSSDTVVDNNGHSEQLLASNRKGYQLIHPYLKSSYSKVRPYDEPIDLTQGPNKRIKHEQTGLNGESIISVLPDSPIVASISKNKGRRSKFNQENITDNQPLEYYFNDIITTNTKQIEILKAAKSLFSKRTRTLYHWMYPNTPKQYIKRVLANSWENLSMHEKQLYISQVLVRFGFPQCNLMVNPQLGGLKSLQPLPEPPTSSSTRELQTAVSSILNSGANCSVHEAKRRQGRPLGSRNRKPLKDESFAIKITNDFQDDPELSKELEKFVISFNGFN